MKATYFLPLALLATATLASAAPRIEQISPATGHIDGTPIAYDLDNDGDLDLAFLFEQLGSGIPGISTTPSSNSSTWLENLGDRQFSAPRTLGHRFNSTRRTSISETLIQSPTSQTATLIHLTTASASGRHELFSKSITSSSWKKIHQFEPPHQIHVLDTPDSKLPLIFSTSSPDTLTLWHAQPDSLTQVDQITLPAAIQNDDDYPSNFQAADLDQDGDADLIFEFDNQTFIYEQISPLKFSDTPTITSLTHALIGDLNLDGKPDLFTSVYGKKIYLNQGDLNFTPSTFSISPSNAHSTSSGILGNQSILIDENYNSINIYHANNNLDFTTEIPFPLSSNATAFLVADFDQDGQSDISFISITNPAPLPIRTGNNFGRVTIPVIYPRPTYDQVNIAWGQQTSFTTPAPATDEAPIICESPGIGDFNNDSFPDLIVGPDINGQARLLINDGEGNFPHSRLLTELQPNEFEPRSFNLQNYVPVDLNGDGNLDLSFTINRIDTSLNLTPTHTHSACVVALGDGKGGFTQVTLPPGSLEIVTVGFCGILEFKDFDNDGDPDAILPGAWRENINGTLREGAFPLIQNAATTDALGNPVNLPSQQIADIDGDSFLDIIIPALIKIPFDPSQQTIGFSFFDRFRPGLAFNTGNGAIQNISDFSADLLVTDALGNPSLLPYLALDLNLDGLREILISEPATDALGNPVVSRLLCRKLNPDSPRDPALAEVIAYPVFSIPLSDELLDFNGDGELEYVADDQFITPTLRGPLISPKYSFRGDHIGPAYRPMKAIAVADFDNDGDIDALYATGFSGLHLVRNTIIDEDSPIPAALMADGLTPAQVTPEADPDKDGRNNALELIHGTDPFTSDESPSQFLTTTLSPEGHRIQFTQRSDASDLALHYDLEISSDLINWSRVSTAAPTIESTEGIWSKVSLEIPRTRSRNYYRISATHDPRR